MRSVVLAVVAFLSGGCWGIPHTSRVAVSEDGKEEIYVRSVVARDGTLRERRVEWIAEPGPNDRCERIVTETLYFREDGRPESRVIESRRCRVVVSRTLEILGPDREVLQWQVAVDVDRDGRFDYVDALPGPDSALSFARIRQLRP